VSFGKLPGVVGTRVGYTGGSAADPTYESVCRGDGHTEAMKIMFDPTKITYEELLDKFFQDHSPFYKSKAQYKSAIWTNSDEQAAVVEKKIAEFQDETSRQVVTDVEPAKDWYDAEDYHQKYIQKQSGRVSIFG